MHRQPAGDLGTVRHGAPPGKPLHEERLPTVQNRQVHVLVEDVLDVLHERHRSLPESQRGRIAVDELPQAQPQPHGSSGAGFKEPVLGQLPDQPVRRGERQLCAVCQLRELKDAHAFREGRDDTHHPVHHRVAGD